MRWRLTSIVKESRESARWYEDEYLRYFNPPEEEVNEEWLSRPFDEMTLLDPSDGTFVTDTTYRGGREQGYADMEPCS